MADAPGGSSGWTALEIIVVLILVIALLNRLQGRNTTSTTSTAPHQQQEIVSKPAPKECGIRMLRPRPLERVQDFVTVSGIVSGCGWDATHTIAVHAQIVDAKGMPVSGYITIPPAQIDSRGASFIETIHLTSRPVGERGYVILYPAASSTLTTSARIPIEFFN